MELELGLRQALTLAPAQRQALLLLRMNAQELGEYLEEQLEANPLLERALTPPPVWTAVSAPPGLTVEQLPDRVGLPLWEYLLAQLEEQRLPGEILHAALYILSGMDGDGRVTETAAEIAAALSCSAETAGAALAAIRTLEPPGVGAANLADCLCLQLERRGETGLPMAIAAGHLDALSRCHYGQIARDLGVREQEVRAAHALIRRLNAHPGAGFGEDGPTAMVLPDVVVRREGETLTAEFNDRAVPSLYLSETYRAMLREGDETVRAFLRERLTQASALLDGVRRRRETVLLCVTALLRRQEAFFRRGPGHLAPLRLADIAEDTGLHISTVSRAVQGKYIQCAYGTFPLSGLFSPRVGAGAVSADMVRAAMVRLIAGEDGAHPLSDAALAAALGERGMAVSRRTVAKYRAALGIPPATGRKK